MMMLRVRHRVSRHNGGSRRGVGILGRTIRTLTGTGLQRRRIRRRNQDSVVRSSLGSGHHDYRRNVGRRLHLLLVGYLYLPLLVVKRRWTFLQNNRPGGVDDGGGGCGCVHTVVATALV